MTMFRVGPAGIPASLKTDMNAVLNKKFGTSGQNYPPKQWPDEVNLLGPLPEGTATGSIAHITDGADEVPIKSWEVEIAPTLTGKSAIECTQTGKNLFNVADYSQIYADRDGVDSYNYRYMIIQLKPNTTYTVSQNSGEYSGTPIILINNALPVGGANYFDLRKASDTKTYTTDSTGQLYIGSVNSYDDVAYSRLQECNVQIEVGSTATTYEPYTTPTQYTATLGRTIYGGTADVVNGEGKETWEKKIYTGANDEYWVLSKSGDIYRYYVINDNAKQPTSGRGVVYSSIGQYSASGNEVGTCFTYYSSGINRVLIYYIPPQTIQTVEDFRVWLQSNNFDVVYEKATPTDFTFAPITPTPETALGVNNFWADEGDTTVVYRRDIDLALQAVSSSRGLMMASRPVTQLVGEESDPDQVNELVENDETEQEGEDDAR